MLLLLSGDGAGALDGAHIEIVLTVLARRAGFRRRRRTAASGRLARRRNTRRRLGRGALNYARLGSGGLRGRLGRLGLLRPLDLLLHGLEDLARQGQWGAGSAGSGLSRLRSGGIGLSGDFSRFRLGRFGEVFGAINLAIGA